MAGSRHMQFMDVNFRFRTQSCHSSGGKFDNLDDRFRPVAVIGRPGKPSATCEFFEKSATRDVWTLKSASYGTCKVPALGVCRDRKRLPQSTWRRIECISWLDWYSITNTVELVCSAHWRKPGARFRGLLSHEQATCVPI